MTVLPAGGENHAAARLLFPYPRSHGCFTIGAMGNAGKNLMGITRALTAGIVASALAVAPVFADADAEREALARIAHELETLEPLIRTAESQASPDARIRFRYDWLRQDLARVRVGIQEHVDAPRAEPRTFPPLRGDYRR